MYLFCNNFLYEKQNDILIRFNGNIFNSHRKIRIKGLFTSQSECSFIGNIIQITDDFCIERGKDILWRNWRQRIVRDGQKAIRRRMWRKESLLFTKTNDFCYKIKENAFWEWKKPLFGDGNGISVNNKEGGLSWGKNGKKGF